MSFLPCVLLGQCISSVRSFSHLAGKGSEPRSETRSEVDMYDSRKQERKRCARARLIEYDTASYVR